MAIKYYQAKDVVITMGGLKLENPGEEALAAINPTDPPMTQVDTFIRALRREPRPEVALDVSTAGLCIMSCSTRVEWEDRGQWDPDGPPRLRHAVIHVAMEVRDRKDGYPIRIEAMEKVRVYPHLSQDDQEDLLYRATRKLLAHTLLHELDETLRVNGRQRVDPHKPAIRPWTPGCPCGAKAGPECTCP